MPQILHASSQQTVQKIHYASKECCNNDMLILALLPVHVQRGSQFTTLERKTCETSIHVEVLFRCYIVSVLWNFKWSLYNQICPKALLKSYYGTLRKWAKLESRLYSLLVRYILHTQQYFHVSVAWKACQINVAPLADKVMAHPTYDV